MTEEKNKLIAEFMQVPHLYSNVRVQTLKYHKDWNWLMPVVEEIEKSDYLDTKISVLIEGNFCQIFSNGDFLNEICNVEARTKIEAVYVACVKFIKIWKKQ